MGNYPEFYALNKTDRIKFVSTKTQNYTTTLNNTFLKDDKMDDLWKLDELYV